MYQPQNFSALFLALLTICSISHAWLYSATNVDLSSPPPINQGSSVIDGVVQSNYSTGTTNWPCYNFPIPNDVSRTPFPIFGGRYSFELTNNTVGSLNDFEFIGDIYIGEISLGDGTYSTPSSVISGGINNGYYGPDVYVWRDFITGPDCSDPVEVLDMVSRALGREDMSPGELVGMNATVGMRIVLFGPDPNMPYYDLADNNYEEMYQCGYITFTDEDLSNNPNAGYCNGGGSPTTGTGASQSTLITSPIASATHRPSPHPHPIEPLPTPSDFVGVTSSNSHTHTVAVGTGVAVSMTVSVLILAIAFIFLRRRKARKHTGTIGADIVVGRQHDIELIKGGKGGKGMAKAEVVESSASSTHSEPPPPYVAAHNRGASGV